VSYVRAATAHAQQQAAVSTQPVPDREPG